jgi:patatin-like phospholipase/acyl hydrolase
MLKSIALGGGGVRGCLLVGALKALEDRQPLEFPDGIYGCSIGSILATMIAFRIPLKKIEELVEEEFILSKFVPNFGISSVTSFTSKKGLFSMDLFEDTLIRVFKSAGIDLKDKVIADAPQKLYIMASNLTTRRATLLTGQIPLLAAIKASSCIPAVFYPQIILNNVDLDGGVYCDCMVDAVPPTTTVFHIAYSHQPIFPADLESMTLATISRYVYAGARVGCVPRPKNVLNLNETSFMPLSDLTLADKKAMIDSGFVQASRFLSKRFLQECFQVS